VSPFARRTIAWAVVTLTACSIELRGGADLAPGDAGAEGGVGGSVFDDAGFGGTAAGSAEAGADADAALEAEAGPVLPYAYRRRLSVAAASGAPAGASLVLRFDHQALVAAGKARKDGNDVRVFRKAGGPSAELHRVLDPVSSWERSDTTLWFRAQAAIGTLADESYYLYFGDPGAGDPPADANQVYAFFDGFEGTALATGWVGAPIGSATGTFSVGKGVLRIEGATGDIWDQADNFLFLHRAMSGSFVLDALVTSSGGSASGWAKLGGVMLRESAAKGARNRIASPVNGGWSITSSYRLATDGTTLEAAKSGAKLVPQYVRLARRFDAARAWHSADGINFTELGSETQFTGSLPDSLLIGIPLANMSSSKGFVEVDWFRARTLVEPEPAVTEQLEEPGPFTP